MSIGVALVLVVVGGLATALAVAIIRFNIRRRRVANAVSRATEAQIDRVYTLLESSDGEPSSGGVLVTTKCTVNDRSSIVCIPQQMPDFPWAGHAFAVRIDKNVEFVTCENPPNNTQLVGRVYRYVAVPRRRLKSGKVRNMFNPSQCLNANAQLRSAVEKIYPDNPVELLSFLICNGRIEFEPIDQARVGTSPAWVQAPEFQYCSICKKRLVLVLQLPGTLVHPKHFHSGTFFLFGCKAHPDELTTIGQFT